MKLRAWRAIGVPTTVTLIAQVMACSGDSPTPPEPGPGGVHSITVQPNPIDMDALGDAVQLTATVRDSQGNTLGVGPVTWQTADPAVATVTESGLLTGVGNGSTQVIARLSGVTGSAPVTVRQVLATIRVEPASVTFTSVGDTMTLRAVAEDGNGNPIPAEFSWESSRTSVATVETAGIVTTSGNGVSDIVARSSGVEGVATVTVEQIPVAIAFAVQPSGALSYGRFEQPVWVEARDARGVRATNSQVDISLELGSNPGAATLSGTRTVRTAVGIASFPDLTLDRSGTGYELVATSPGLASVTSTPFDVRPTPFAYVVNNSVYTVSVVRISDLSVVATVDVGVRPYDAAMSPDGSRVYVVNSNSNSISVIGTATNEVVATVPVSASPSAVEVTPDGAFVLVTYGDVNVDELTYIDTSNNTVAKTVAVPGGSSGIAVTRDGAFAYLSGYTAFSVVDLVGDSLLKDIDGAGRLRDVVVAPDEPRAYATNEGDTDLPASVAVVNVADHAVIDHVEGARPRSIALSPDGLRAYVTTIVGMSVLETQTGTNLADVPIYNGPRDVAVTPDGRLVLVAVAGDNSVVVIDASTFNPIDTVTVGTNPIAIAVGLTDASRIP